MKFASLRSALVVAACLFSITALLPGVAKADNPIVQQIYTADPAPLVYNGRVYLYTGHDEDGSTYFTMREWRVWSSADMVNWTDHGSPMNPFRNQNSGLCLDVYGANNNLGQQLDQWQCKNGSANQDFTPR